VCHPWVASPTSCGSCRDFVVANLARCAGPRLVVETVHTAFGKAIAPCANGRSADTDLGSDLLVVETARCNQHNARPLRQSLRRTVLARQSRQFALLHIIECTIATARPLAIPASRSKLRSARM